MPTWSEPTGAGLLRMSGQLLSQNVAGNKSRVRMRLWIEVNSPATNIGSPGKACSIAGVGSTVSDTFTWAAGTKSKTIIQFDRDVAHDSDGTKTLTLHGAIADTGTSGIGGPTVNGPRTWVLPTIARATQPDFTPKPADAGSAISISLPRASSGFTHDLVAGFGGVIDEIATGVGTSHTWTPPLSLLERIPDATSGAFSIGAYTKSGSTEVGYKSVTSTLRAPSSVIPTVSNITFTDQNPDVASIVGKPVQSLSRIRFAVTAAGIYGSTIAKRETVFQGATVAAGTDITVTSSGTVAVTGRATDSRGRTGQLAGTVDVLPYTGPRATAYQVRRANSAGTLVDDGLYLRVDLDAEVRSLINSTERNALTVRAFTRPHGTGAWTARNVITPAGLTTSGHFLISGGGIFAATSSWDVRVEVHDKFGKQINDTTVATASVTLDLNGTALGVGKIHEQGALDVAAGGIYDDGKLVLNTGDLATNAETQTGSATGKAVTPASLASRTATTSRAGLAELATQAEVDAGTDTSRIVTPKHLRDRNYAAYSTARGRASVGASGDTTVTFPSGRFTQPPVVTATGEGGLYAVRITNITATSMQLRLYSLASNQLAGTIMWHAEQATSGSASG